MIKISTLVCTAGLIGIVTVNTVTALREFHKDLPIAVRLAEPVEDPRIARLIGTLSLLDCPEPKQRAVSKAIIEASDKIQVDPVLIAALMKTESSFDMTAESNKGYKGLMQTPYASKRWEDVDILIGARILEEKLKLTRGNIEMALALYKGGDNPLAKRQAAQVLALYKGVRDGHKVRS